MLTVYTRARPQADQVAWGPYTAAPGADDVDFQATGRLFRLRFDFNSAPAYWRGGVQNFNVKQRGKK